WTAGLAPGWTWWSAGEIVASRRRFVLRRLRHSLELGFVDRLRRFRGRRFFDRGLHFLLGRELSALRNDRDPQRRAHVGEELDGNLVASDALDRVAEVDLAAVDADAARAPDLVGDRRRRDRSEQHAGGPRLHVEAYLLPL